MPSHQDTVIEPIESNLYHAFNTPSLQPANRRLPAPQKCPCYANTHDCAFLYPREMEVSRKHPRRYACHDTHPHDEESNLKPGLPKAVLSRPLSLAASPHACSPAVGRECQHAPDLNCWKRDMVEEHTRDNPHQRLDIEPVGVSEQVVRSGDDTANNNIEEGDINHVFCREEIIQNRYRAEERAKFSFQHPVEQKRVAHSVDPWLEKRFNVSGPRPSHLLLEPSGHRRWSVGCREDVRGIDDTPATQ
jgi:hypothetical protein